MSLLKKFSSGFFWNQIAKVFHMGGTFFLGVLLARYLGTGDYGTFAALLSIVAAFSIIGSLGFETLMTSRISGFSENRSSSVVRALLLIRLGILMLFSLLLFFLAPLVSGISEHPVSKYMHVVLLYLCFFSFNNFFAAICMGLFKVREVALIRSLAMFVNLSGTFLLLEARFGIEAVFMLLATVAFLVSLAYLYILKEMLFVQVRAKSDLFPLLRFSVVTWLSDCCNYILGRQMDIILILLLLKNTSEVAFYEVAFGLTMAVGTLMTAGAEGVSLAAFSEIETKKDRTLFSKAWTMHFKLDVILLVIPICFCVWFAAPIVRSIYTEKYDGSIDFFIVFLLSTLFVRLWGGGTTTTILLTIGKERAVLWCRLGYGALNIALNLLLIPFLGVMGAVTGTCISAGMLSFTEFLILKKTRSFLYPAIFIVKVFSVSMICGLLFSQAGLEKISLLLFAGVLYILTLVAIFSRIKLFDCEEKEYFSHCAPFVKSLVRRF